MLRARAVSNSIVAVIVIQLRHVFFFCFRENESRRHPLISCDVSKSNIFPKFRALCTIRATFGRRPVTVPQLSYKTRPRHRLPLFILCKQQRRSNIRSSKIQSEISPRVSEERGRQHQDGWLALLKFTFIVAPVTAENGQPPDFICFCTTQDQIVGW